MTWDPTGKRVVVVGLGTSGVAACSLLVKRGARVVANDVRANVPAIPGCEMVLGGHAAAKLEEADLVVVSPGVPPFAELAIAEANGVPIWGEVELAVRLLAHPAKLVAIGGTNGKSTVTSLVGALLEAGGLRVFTGGNLGEPLAAHADEAFDVVVLEVSSFQMERVDSFHPHVAVLLNVTPDHLDRYPGMDAYAHAKGNMFLRQGLNDLAVVPVNDPVCEREARRGKGRVVRFGPGGDIGVAFQSGRNLADVSDATSLIVDRSTGVRYERRNIKLQGGHNTLNVMAALAAIAPFDIHPAMIKKVLASFEGLAHRMAFVAEHAGVRYYDDSKGTNVGASVTAVRGIAERKVVLVAGGRDKGGSYAPLVDALRERGRGAVLIGEAAAAISEAIGDVVPVTHAETMGEAVRAAAALAQKGDAVLLSPACSSFDMFKDYKARGDAFVAAVKALAQEGEAK